VTVLDARVRARLQEEGLASGLCLVLDGLAPGDDGTLWGGEAVRATPDGCVRVGTFKPVALPGGAAAAAREPWRSTYAHLMAEMGWTRFAMNYDGIELFRFLDARRGPLEGAPAPRASSCEALLDAAAAALGLCREGAAAGAAARALEAVIDRAALAGEDEELAYPFAVPRLRGSGLPYVEPLAAWEALLGDLYEGTSPGVVAARFHRGLARAVARLATKAADGLSVVLAGGDAHPTLVAEIVRLTGGLPCVSGSPGRSSPSPTPPTSWLSST
jgi:hydrogenase maturation protein HypF